MAKRINFWELPIEDAQPDDTVPAYRGRGQVARVRMADVGGDGTVTSVAVSMPTGFSVANSPVTTSGTITVTFAAGYGLPTTTQMGQWSTAYSWGDHSQAGYALASAVTSALAGKVDKVAGKGLSTEDYSTAEKGKLAGIQAGAQVNAVTSVAGKTGAVTLAKGDVGLGNVDNTSDADKPISTAVSTALSAKVDTSDTRLTDSREWTASTVSQAEAEAGTATTRRAWTAQRVWQAIAAWWNASAAKLKLDGIQEGATANQTDAYLRNRANHTGTQPASTVTGLAAVATSGNYNDLSNRPTIPAAQVQADWNASSGVAAILNKPDLGSAAGVNLTTSNDSTSMGQVTKVGDYGLPYAIVSDPDSNRVSGFYSIGSAGITYDGITIPGWATYLNLMRNSSGHGEQLFMRGNRMFFRTNGSGDAFGPLREVWQTGNFDPSSKANVSHSHSASDITSGTLSDARLPSTQAGKTFTSPIQVTGAFDINGSGPGQQQNGLYIADLGGTKGTTNNPTYTTALAWQTNASRSNAISVDDQGRLWAFRSHSNAGTYTFRSRVEEADKLTTARTINGTSFNGTGNITTANWGTARTLTVGNTGKSVNGSANVSWSLAEIGAAPAETTYSKIEVNNLLAGYVTPAAMSSFTYDKATIDSKIDAGGGGGGEETYPYRGSLGTRDLNDVRDPGLWGQSVHADATLARNYPFEGVPGALEVLTLNPDTTPYAITTQRYTTNEGGQRIAIRRGGAQGGWSAWREIAIGVGTNAYRDATISTTNPSGGSDGDVWYQIDS